MSWNLLRDVELEWQEDEFTELQLNDIQFWKIFTSQVLFKVSIL